MLSPAFSLTAWESWLPATAKAWLYIFSTVVLVRLIFLHYHHGLHRYDGPFMASLTDFWRMFHAYRNRDREPMLYIHEKYGDVVRTAPNVLSFRQPQAIKDIYGAGKHYKKSGYYPVFAAINKGEPSPSLFSSCDQVWHNTLRRSVGAIYTQNSIVKHESLIDDTLSVFLNELSERFAGREGRDGIMDLHTWLLYFAFDIVGDLTYGARQGFIEHGEDVSGIIAQVKGFLNHGYYAGHIPAVYLFIRHNPIWLWLERKEWISSSSFAGVPFAIKHMRERLKRYAADAEKNAGHREDILDRFLKARQDRPEIVTEREVLGLSLSIMIAGSEPTAISLTAFFYYLLRTPGCYAKLQEELDTHLPPKDPADSFCMTKFGKANTLSYLRACVQETQRIHPVFGFNYERIVPPSGTTICGHAVPGGTVVGVSPWAVHRDQGIFGEDANSYRPERWLADPDRVKEMEKTMFQFGAGDHICLGKNIALVEIYKLIPTLMRNFELSLANPTKEWTLENGAAVAMNGVDVRIRRR